MGCWNGTCAVSNLHVTNNQDVVVLLLLQNNEEKSLCYGNALYDLCPVPFYGKYNDYGAVEDCEGIGLNIVVEALRDRLYRFGEGPNEYHDIEVNKENFNIEKLFEADLEGRLGIEHRSSWNNNQYDLGELQRKREDKGLTDSQQFELDRLLSKIRQEDTFRRVTHVIIHGDVFRGILNNWYIKDYGHEDVYFKKLEDSIPEYIRRIRANHEELKIMENGSEEQRASRFRRFMSSTGSRDVFEWNDPCMAGRWMNHFVSDSSSTWGLVHVPEMVREYTENEKWDELEKFTKEVLTVAWINSFMAFTRKIWTPQTGSGSQNSEHVGYKVLAKTVLNILNEEKKQYGYDEDEEVIEILKEKK